jgi:hypothetical protein
MSRFGSRAGRIGRLIGVLSVLVAPHAAYAQNALPPAAAAPAERAARRLMLPLYSTFVGMQLLDVHSTTRALNAGSTEGNALMSGVAGSPMALMAVKAGATAATIYLIEKTVRKRSRVAAIVAMVGVDSAYALIVAHNYRSAR